MRQQFNRDPSEVVRARHMVGATLRSWGLERELSAFELAVSELMSNAVLHGAGTVEVRLHDAGGALRLEVVDEGDEHPSPRDGSPADGMVGGWGLRVVDQLSDDWGTASDAGHTLVWMERHPHGYDHLSATARFPRAASRHR